MRLGVVKEWEAELKTRPYNRVLRDKLTYYGKNRWRRVFLYQEVAATRIQRWYKGKVEYRRFWKTLRSV